MLTALLILCCGIPAAVCVMIVVEEYVATGRRIARDRMFHSLRHIFGTGLLSGQASAAQIAGGAFRLFAWMAALGGVLAEMLHAWPAANGIAIWLVVACGGLEIVRYLPAERGYREFPSRLRSMATWLVIVCTLAGLGILFGSFNLATIAQVQAQYGFWTAMIQPLGCAGFLIAVLAVCLNWPAQTEGLELIDHLQCTLFALLAVGLFGGGWYFWGITTYTTNDNVSLTAVVLRAMVVAAKLTVVLCGLALMRAKCTVKQSPDIQSSTVDVLLMVAGTNLMIALAAETWLRPEDFMTRGMLSWIVAGGLIAYGLMFHRTHVAAFWKGMLVDDTETGG